MGQFLTKSSKIPYYCSPPSLLGLFLRFKNIGLKNVFDKQCCLNIFYVLFIKHFMMNDEYLKSISSKTFISPAILEMFLKSF